jgi:hypothetical protein
MAELMDSSGAVVRFFDGETSLLISIIRMYRSSAAIALEMVSFSHWERHVLEK